MNEQTGSPVQPGKQLPVITNVHDVTPRAAIPDILPPHVTLDEGYEDSLTNRAAATTQEGLAASVAPGVTFPDLVRYMG